ncbi:TIGR01459 family HAD-type hydrolase [Parasulfitobacter algicola]|uniref:TIGR01459 family HAD-type hydrolase n=1 Tax=Parasulfitobacter algicola TaxID=2614809 RepID=A0ABX2ITN5_9RHOB|nr:TIGR01459 family HAD-type hydrolase [Sulfitobacter algicola]NSX53533.1 TIGR01459 family HAD-type hydrolase [Sulfitobacter algicola]
MTQLIDSISSIADQFEAIVLDQWGVLHDGSAPYPKAIQTLEHLKNSCAKLGVLSNSGKRAVLNAMRISDMGFDVSVFDTIMTSGEALWQVFASGDETAQFLYPIEARPGDAANWAEGLQLKLVDDVSATDAVLLMGLPDGSDLSAYDEILHASLDRNLPFYCSNPDLTAPRGGGTYVTSPGALAERYKQMGGIVHLFGKPHRPIFDAMQKSLGCAPDKILMVGDSLHHDILGAQTAGWQSLLIQVGVHRPDICNNTIAQDILRLSKAAMMDPPNYSLPDLR